MNEEGINPYVAGNPVRRGRGFVGREDILNSVHRVLRRSGDNAVLLHGQRRIGKTSILETLTRWLPEIGSYRTLYFDLHEKAQWPLGRILTDLARQVDRSLNLESLPLGDEPETTFQEEWLPRLRDELGDTMLVVCFDEFDVLADPDGPRGSTDSFFRYIQNLLRFDPERLAFVFVIGRNLDDLDSIARSVFKSVTSKRVSLLTESDTGGVIRLSEENGSLKWSGRARNRVWELTRGHPYLTQQLCSQIWELAYDDEPDATPLVEQGAVENAVSDTLDASQSTLQWLWDGLTPSTRLVASALAQAGGDAMGQDQLEATLHESGVRIILRELRTAPRLLEEWDLIEPDADGHFFFKVELLRRWIAEYKPLDQVQKELDFIEPEAENLYQVAVSRYKRKQQLAVIVQPLEEALQINPNHIRSSDLLGQVLLRAGELARAREVVERLYEFHPGAARPRLVQVALAQAEATDDEDERISLFERVLEVEQSNPEAAKRLRAIWLERAAAAEAEDQLAIALDLYARAGSVAHAGRIEDELRRRELVERLVVLEALVGEERFSDAVDLLDELDASYPDLRDWSEERGRLEARRRLEAAYQRAMAATAHDPEQAVGLYTQILTFDVRYKDALRHLYEIVSGVRVDQLQERLEETRAEVGQLRQRWKQQEAAFVALRRGIDSRMRAGRHRDASELAEAVVAVRPEILSNDAMTRLRDEADPVRLHKRGMGAQAAGNNAEAAQLLAQVVAHDPQYPGAAHQLLVAVGGPDAYGLENQVKDLEALLEQREQAELRARKSAEIAEDQLALTRMRDGNLPVVAVMLYSVCGTVAAFACGGSVFYQAPPTPLDAEHTPPTYFVAVRDVPIEMTIADPPGPAELWLQVKPQESPWTGPDVQFVDLVNVSTDGGRSMYRAGVNLPYEWSTRSTGVEYVVACTGCAVGGETVTLGPYIVPWLEGG